MNLKLKNVMIMITEQDKIKNEIEFWNSIQKSLKSIDDAINTRKKNLCIIEDNKPTIQKSQIKEFIREQALNTEQKTQNQNPVSTISETVKKEEPIKETEVLKQSKQQKDPLGTINISEDDSEILKPLNDITLEDDDGVSLDDDPFKGL